jgi:hypothetical protein
VALCFSGSRIEMNLSEAEGKSPYACPNCSENLTWVLPATIRNISVAITHFTVFLCSIFIVFLSPDFLSFLLTFIISLVIMYIFRRSYKTELICKSCGGKTKHNKALKQD